MLWLLAFSHPLWAAAPKPVTLVVDDVPVVQVLQALIAQENRNLVVSPDVNGTISLNLTRVDSLMRRWCLTLSLFPMPMPESCKKPRKNS
ncbi:hypothetical protein GVv1_43610 [Enterobacter pseudoroggenkampii]